jgi:predicted Zn-dependent protease
VALEYENPQVPDEVNLPQSHPLVDFSWMLLAVGGAGAAAILSLAFIADYLVSYVPFELEERLVDSFDVLEAGSLGNGHTPSESNQAADQEIQTYLQSLADALLEQDPLPDGMSVTVHYRNDSVVNAFATLGGHVIIHQGLLSKLQSENALSMVMAHEIEHIRARHPIRAAGRGIIITLALLSMTGFSDSSALESLVEAIGLVSTLSFSRDHELKADEAALKIMLRHYGHVEGADQLFEMLAVESQSEEFMAFLSTHPLHDDRIDAVKHLMSSDGVAVLVPLPVYLSNQR